MYPEFGVPEDQKKAWLADRQGAIVGADTVKRFGWKVGERDSARRRRSSAGPTARPWEFNISGIYDSPVKGTDKTQLFFHYDYLNEAVRSTRLRQTRSAGYVIRVNDPDAVAGDREEDRHDVRQLADRDEDRQREGLRGRLGEADRQHLPDHAARSPRAAIFMMLLVTANTMAQSIRERTSELAVLKTLGFGDGRVLSMVLMESCVLALVGGLAGLGAGLVLVVAGGRSRPDGFLPAFYLPTRDADRSAW